MDYLKWKQKKQSKSIGNNNIKEAGRTNENVNAACFLWYRKLLLCKAVLKRIAKCGFCPFFISKEKINYLLNRQNPLKMR